MTKDQLRAVLEGGKHHEVLKVWLADDAAVLQYRYAAIGVWNDYWQTVELDHIMELRIKPKTLRYRVALYRTTQTLFLDAPLNELYTTAVNTVTQMRHLETSAGFVRWLCDWQEIEVTNA